MEDISRELEEEIARSKPSEYKRKKSQQILVVDDLGQMRCASYLLVLIKTLWVLVIVLGLVAGGLFFLYFNSAREKNSLQTRVKQLEARAGQLKTEKEMLMAKLVIAGKAALITDMGKAGTPDRSGSQIEETEKTEIDPEPGPSVDGSEESEAGNETIADDSGQDRKTAEPLPAPAPETTVQNGEDNMPAGQSANQVAVEKFTLSQSEDKETLLVRFDIKNISGKKNEGISGRIFTLLKPEGALDEDWLVLPGVVSGMPVEQQYKRGQYFSITHYKPVRFKIRDSRAPKAFTSALVLVFDEEGRPLSRVPVTLTGNEDN